MDLDEDDFSDHEVKEDAADEEEDLIAEGDFGGEDAAHDGDGGEATTLLCQTCGRLCVDGFCEVCDDGPVGKAASVKNEEAVEDEDADDAEIPPEEKPRCQGCGKISQWNSDYTKLNVGDDTCSGCWEGRDGRVLGGNGGPNRWSYQAEGNFEAFCEHCGRGFKNKGSYRRHVELQHLVKREGPPPPRPPRLTAPPKPRSLLKPKASIKLKLLLKRESQPPRTEQNPEAKRQEALEKLAALLSPSQQAPKMVPKKQVVVPPKPSQFLVPSPGQGIPSSSSRYVCKYCSATFDSRVACAQHVNEHLKFQCAFCKKWFTDQGNLLAHLTVVHKMPVSASPSVKKEEKDQAVKEEVEQKVVIELSDIASDHPESGESKAENTKDASDTPCVPGSMGVEDQVDQPQEQSYAGDDAVHMSDIEGGQSEAEGIDEGEGPAEDTEGQPGQADEDDPPEEPSEMDQQSLEDQDQDGEGRPSTFSCDDCGRVLTTREGLRRHVKLRHLKLRPHVCRYCGARFGLRQSLKGHEYKKHQRKPTFWCKVCGMGFHLRGHMDTHMLKSHPDVSAFICDVCGKSSTTRAALRIHEKIHSGIKNEECEFCGKLFRMREHLSRHIETVHLDIARYECKYCGQRFKSSSGWHLHEETHTGTRKLISCKECGRTFTSASGLEQHHRVKHKGILPFHCSYCGKDFPARTQRDLHVKCVHLDIKDIPCPFCGRLFGTKDNLKRHVFQFHKQKLSTKEIQEAGANVVPKIKGVTGDPVENNIASKVETVAGDMAEHKMIKAER